MVLLNAKIEALTTEKVMHFYVGKQDRDECDDASIADLYVAEGEALDGAIQGQPSSVRHYFTLLATPMKASRQRSMPTIDYIKSTILTSSNYITALENRSAAKEAVIHEQEEKRKEREATKKRRAEEKKLQK